MNGGGRDGHWHQLFNCDQLTINNKSVFFSHSVKRHVVMDIGKLINMGVFSYIDIHNPYWLNQELGEIAGVLIVFHRMLCSVTCMT